LSCLGSHQGEDSDTAKLELDFGRKQTDEALEGTMADMPRHLALAIHQLVSAAEVPRAALPFSANLAEEGFACTNAGVQIGAGFCKAHPDFGMELVCFESCGVD